MASQSFYNFWTPPSPIQGRWNQRHCPLTRSVYPISYLNQCSAEEYAHPPPYFQTSYDPAISDLCTIYFCQILNFPLKNDDVKDNFRKFLCKADETSYSRRKSFKQRSPKNELKLE